MWRFVSISLGLVSKLSFYISLSLSLGCLLTKPKLVAM